MRTLAPETPLLSQLQRLVEGGYTEAEQILKAKRENSN